MISIPKGRMNEYVFVVETGFFDCTKVMSEIKLFKNPTTALKYVDYLVELSKESDEHKLVKDAYGLKDPISFTEGFLTDNEKEEVVTPLHYENNNDEYIRFYYQELEEFK